MAGISKSLVNGDKPTHLQTSPAETNEDPSHHNNDSNATDNQDAKKKFKISRLTRKSKLTLALLCFANIFVGCGFSLMAPFFPQEAEKKNVSDTVTGLIFSTYQLVIFLSSPIYGNYMTRIGPKFMFVAGELVGGVCSILFGTLDKCPPGLPFIIITFACRFVEALGLSAFITSSFAIVSNEFPNHVSTIFGMLETASGIGFMVGPALGGILYETGGFGLPFFVIGGLIMSCGTIIFILLPPPQDTKEVRKASVFSFLRSIMVLMTLQTVFMASIGITFLDPVFSKYLEQFNLSTVLIGLMFVIAPGVYGFTTPFWGYLTDSKNVEQLLIVSGTFLCFCSSLITGSSPYLPFLPVEIWVIIIGLVVFGASIGCTLIPTMKCLLIGAGELGFENNLDTYGIVSGLFYSVYCLGGFIGPTLSGSLVQQFGFRYTTTLVGGLFLLSSLSSGCYFTIRHLRIKHRQRQQQKHPIPQMQNGTAHEITVRSPDISVIAIDVESQSSQIPVSWEKDGTIDTKL